ncbi:MAG: divalent metal cation transporter [Pseudomonadota bacterium]
MLKALGPGLLFAGAAVGVSHLVQSTRAGAAYGLALIAFVIIANIAKYPAFRIGNQYAAASGENLVVGYRRQGLGALWLFVAATCATMFAGCAAISLTTAALAKATFNLPFDILHIVFAIWGIIGAILFFGQYRALDLTIKVLLSFMTFATLVSTALVLPHIPFQGLGDFWPTEFDKTTILFIAALVGWMPAPLDTSVWQSLWSQAKTRTDNRQASMAETAADFNIGFFGTTVLAVCFVLMGAGVIFNEGVVIEASAAGFAQQVIDLYGSTIGQTAATLVGAAAMAVVFSTTLTAIDAWPRTMAGVALIIRSPDGEGAEEIAHAAKSIYYWGGMALLLIGTTIILQFLMNAFSTLIDIATTVSFLTAPIFALLNHRAMFGAHVPLSNRPGAGLRLWSIGGVAVLGSFALFYCWIALLT